MAKKGNKAAAFIQGLGQGYLFGEAVKEKKERREDRRVAREREDARYGREQKSWADEDAAAAGYEAVQKYDPKLEPYEDVQGPIDPNNPRKLGPQQEWDMRAKKVLEFERNLPAKQRAQYAGGITDQKAQLMGSWMEQFKPENVDANGVMSNPDSIRFAQHSMAGKMKLGQPPSPQEQVALSQAAAKIEEEGYEKAINLAHQGRFSEAMKEFNNTGKYRGYSMEGSPVERVKDFGGGNKLRYYEFTVVGPNGERVPIDTFQEVSAIGGIKTQMQILKDEALIRNSVEDNEARKRAEGRAVRSDARAEQEALRQEREHAIRMDRQVAVTTARERLRDARARGNKAEIAEAEQMVRDAGGDLSTPADPKRTTHIDSTTGTAYIMEGGVPVGQIPVSEIPQFKRPGAAAAAAGTKEEKVDVAGGFAKTAASAADLLTGNARLLRPTQPEGVSASGKKVQAFASQEAAKKAADEGRIKPGDTIVINGKTVIVGRE